MPTSDSTAPLRPLTPFSASSRGLTLFANANREAGALVFSFRLSGDLFQAKMPALAPVESRRRRDGLWQHTCLELFWGAPNDPAYFELNLAPSGDWNLYQFSGYRSGMKPVEMATPPQLSCEIAESTIHWRGRLETPWGGSAPWELGASAVIEYADETLEYWAFAHPGEKPDFHLRGNFILSLVGAPVYDSTRR